VPHRTLRQRHTLQTVLTSLVAVWAASIGQACSPAGGTDLLAALPAAARGSVPPAPCLPGRLLGCQTGVCQCCCWVRILPAEASVLVDAPDADVLLIDARRDLPATKSLTKLLHSTGVGCPIIAITTEGGLTAMNADWGIDDVILDTAGPAEVDARIRIALWVIFCFYFFVF